MKVGTLSLYYNMIRRIKHKIKKSCSSQKKVELKQRKDRIELL